MNIPKLRFPEFSGEWEEKKLADIASYSTSRGKCFEKNYVTTENMNKNYCGVSFNNSETVKDGIAFSENDILFANIRPYLKKVWLSDRNGCVNSDVLVFHISNCSPNFINNIFCSDIFLSHVMNGVKGTKMPRGDKNQILEFNIKIPSLPEQQKIADFLSTVDSIITSETKILNALQKKKKALMQKLFSQQLRFKADDGSEFPEWEEKKLGEISSSPKYGLNASGIDYDGEHKYLRITDIDEVTHTFSPEEITTPSEFSDDYLLEENDIVFARTGASTGKTYLYNPNDGDLYFAGFLIKFHIKDANARFVFYQTCTHKYEKWVHVMSTRSGQPGINSEEYSTLKIKLPCIEEQQKIADCLSSLDLLIQNQQKVVTTWQQRKKALLQQMFI